MGWREFRDDLKASAAAWGKAPLLPVASVILGLGIMLPDELWWLLLPFALLELGWLGSQRVWYLRIYRHDTIHLSELARLTVAFLWRFVRLGLLVLLTFACVIGGGKLVLGDVPLFESGRLHPRWVIPLTLMSLMMDFALTFVTQALAFTTHRVRDAFKIGLELIRVNWPGSTWYVFAPPLTVTLFARLAAPGLNGMTAPILMAVVSFLLNLWFKGATARLYLRRHSVGRDGAAFVREQKN